MGKPHQWSKPDLSRLATRQIKLDSNRNHVEFALFDWMKDVVRATKNPPTVGVSRETELVGTASDSIDVLMHAPSSMAIGAAAGQRTVHADFYWERLPDGQWYVRSVNFHLALSQQELRLAQQRALKERLQDQAEATNAHHVHLRPLVFPAEQHTATWPQDAQGGDFLINLAIERAAEHGRKDAATIENPVAPVDMALDMVGLGVGAGKAASHGAEHLASAYEAIDKGRTAKGIGDRMRDGEIAPATRFSKPAWMWRPTFRWRARSSGPSPA